MEDSWKKFIDMERDCDYFKNLMSYLDLEYENTRIYPPKREIFNALELTPYNSVNCVIIGQDPYFNPGEAHGLAFSVNRGVKIPPSLRNIYKELESDLGVTRDSGDLTSWARSGVLLLNRVLTVIHGRPNSHRSIGWLEFTEKIIVKLSNRERPLVFMLWGAEAGKLSKIIDSRHLILKAPHPSPLSSYRGFFGCRHFSKCNEFLRENGLGEINWGE